jgi:hypothetical protein
MSDDDKALDELEDAIRVLYRRELDFPFKEDR